MKNPCFLGMLVIACLSPLAAAKAGSVEADFNDLFVGNMRTDGGAGPNVGNVDTGTGFSENGYFNNTGIVLALADDLAVPGSVTNFVSVQQADINAGPGVAVGVAEGDVYRRAHERAIVPLTGNTVWFSCLIRLSPSSEAHLLFNVDGNTEGGAAGGFGVLMGDNDFPGTLGIILNSAGYLSAAGTEITPRADATIPTDGSSHVILGRIDVSDAGDDTLSLWFDPADALSPGAPTVSTTADFVGAAGITALSFEFVRRAAGSAAAIDHVRVSDEPGAAYFVTGNAIPSLPGLEIDGASPAPDLAFGSVYLADPVNDLVSRTLTYVNSGSAELSIEAIFLTGGSGAFALGAVPGTPFTLQPAETFDVEVLAGAGGETNGRTSVGELVIESDFSDLDQSVPVSATVTAAGDAVCLNANPTLDSGKGQWIGNTGGALASGFIPGSAGAIRVKGINDPAANAPDSISQTVPGGQSDFELKTWIALSDYFPPVGASGDRAFQLILHADTDVPGTADGNWTDTHADSAMINLAYFPDGAPGNASAGFYLFNGSSWEPVAGLPTLALSTDIGGDGNLVANEGDTINAYQITVSGNGFGSAGATYAISVSDANAETVAATASGLSVFHAADIASGTPRAFSFTTGDISAGSGAGALTGSFWFDDTCFSNGAVYPAALATVVSQPGVSAAFEGTPAAETATFALRNGGLGEDLSVSAVSFGSAAFSLVAPGLPVDIAPGETQVFTYQFDASALAGESIAASGVSIASNGAVASIDLSAARGLVYMSGKPVFNGGFEFPGDDPVGGSDTFLAWEELNNASLAADAAGLVAGSATAAYLGGTDANETPASNALVQQTLLVPAADFQADMVFAVKDTPNRQFYVQLYPATGTVARLTLRYQSGVFAVYDGALASWIDVLTLSSPLLASDDGGDGSLDPGDTKNAYRLRITGRGWDTAANSYDLEVFGDSGQPLGSATDIAIFREAAFLPAARIQFSTQYGFCPGFWIDDVCVGPILQAARFEITHVSYDDILGEVTLRWNDTASGYLVEGADGLFDPVTFIPVDPGNGAIDTGTFPGQIEFRFVDPGFTGPNRFWRVLED